MEQHSYGYGGQLGPAASQYGSSATDTRPQGWSSLTRLHRNSPPPQDAFPPLTTNNTTPSETLNIAHLKRSRQHQPRVSPSSSTESLSSNCSGRNEWAQADAQTAHYTNAAISGDGLCSVGSPPESSCGSLASSFLQSGGSVPGSSASSFSFNLYANDYRLQSGPCDTGPFQTGNRALNVRERFVSGKTSEQESSVKRNYRSYTLADDSRKDASFAVNRNNLDRPAVYDGRSSIGNLERGSNGAHEQGKDFGNYTAASSAFHPPLEPEWEEDDLYLRIRSDARKEARARDKFAKGASQAYICGDHRKAKTMSRQAQEKRLIAEKLHAEAASKILNERNKSSSFDIWNLDLHGLHGTEAVAALERRLALLESRLADDHTSGVLSSDHQLLEGQQDPGFVFGKEPELPPQASQKQMGHMHTWFQSLVSTPKLLSIVTGVGTHSQGGPTLPSVVRNFLLNKGYDVDDTRAGVIYIRPKLRLSIR